MIKKKEKEEILNININNYKKIVTDKFLHNIYTLFSYENLYYIKLYIENRIENIIDILILKCSNSLYKSILFKNHKEELINIYNYYKTNTIYNLFKNNELESKYVFFD